MMTFSESPVNGSNPNKKTLRKITSNFTVMTIKLEVIFYAGN